MARSPVSSRPTGTVTFLFSDIEGSTMRWEHDRRAMNAALRRHDRVMRRSIEAHGGYIFKTVGDEFCSAFSNAQDALEAAVDAQRALAAEDFASVGGMRVRMALNTGSAEERDGDYFGPTVNRAARLMSIAHGGQVLVSASSVALLRGNIPPGTSLRDLGAHRLKDLGSEHVQQVVVAGLPDEFPSLRSPEAPPNNLPPQLTSFIGREMEVGEIKVLLESHRVVTLVGAGGAGKTRCATHVGGEVVQAYEDGVWFVELAPISDPTLIANAIAQALNVYPLPGKPVFDTVLHYLKYKRMLIVLDNCEHLIDEARNTITAIVRACSEIRILATSREPLNIGGELAFRMPSLPVPPADTALTPDAVLSYGAPALFAARAVAADSHFAVTASNVPAITEICRRIDGIPLAIELAAARIKVLSPMELAQKLDDRFRVLTGGDRAALPRQQTMRALIDWSYDLLTGQERATLRKFSIFAGGCTLATARAVCADASLDEMAVLDVLSSLVDKSLIQAELVRESTRYRLLESTRQYAREKLVESGEQPRVSRAHAEAFLTLAESLQDVSTVPDREWSAKADPEIDNWRAALEWTLGARNDVLLGQRLVVATRRTWSSTSVAEGLRWLQAALDSVDATTPPSVVADLDQTEALLKGVAGLHKASLAAAERALTRYKTLNDALGVAKARRQAGRSLVILGRIAEGEELLRDALEAFRRAGDAASIGAALDNLGIARGADNDISGARTFFAEALAVFKSIGADRLAVAVENNLAESEFHAGNPLESLRLANDALALSGPSSVAHRRALLLSNVAAYLIALSRYDEARERAREALAMARSLNYAAVMLWAMQRLANISMARSNAHRPRVAQLLGYVDAQVETLQLRREFTEQQEHDDVFDALRDILGQAACAGFMAEGRTWNEERAVTEALLL